MVFAMSNLQDQSKCLRNAHRNPRRGHARCHRACLCFSIAVACTVAVSAEDSPNAEDATGAANVADDLNVTDSGHQSNLTNSTSTLENETAGGHNITGDPWIDLIAWVRLNGGEVHDAIRPAIKQEEGSCSGADNAGNDTCSAAAPAQQAAEAAAGSATVGNAADAATKATQPSGQLSGFVTSAALEAGDLVLRLPAAIWTHGDKRLNAPPEVKCPEIGELNHALSHAMEIHNGQNSAHWPHLNMLPDVLSEIDPVLAGPEVLADFGALPVIKVLGDSRNKLEEAWFKCFARWRNMTWEQDREAIENNGTLSSVGRVLNGLSWFEVEMNLHYVRTRALMVESLSVGVPILDSFKIGTSSRVNTEFTRNGSDFEVRTLAPVPAGAELLVERCHDCDNEELLHRYGVYLEDNPVIMNKATPVDCVAKWSREANPNATVASLRKAALAELDLEHEAEALAQNLSAPRCLLLDPSPASAAEEPAAAASANGSDAGVSPVIPRDPDKPLRCALARLAWEHCAEAWGFKAWRPTSRRGRSRSASAPALHAMAHNIVAELHLLSEEIDMAEASHLSALRADPSSFVAHFGLGRIDEQREDFVAAEASYSAAAQARPTDWRAWYLAGELQRNLSRLDEAEDSLKRALALHNKSWQVYESLTQVYHTQRRVEEGKKSYAWYLRRLSEEQAEDELYEEAEETARRALATDRKQEGLTDWFFFLLHAQGKLEEFLKTLPKKEDDDDDDDEDSEDESKDGEDDSDEADAAEDDGDAPDDENAVDT